MALLAILIVYVLVFHLHWHAPLQPSQLIRNWIRQVDGWCEPGLWQGWARILLAVLFIPFIVWLIFYSLDDGFGLLLQLVVALVVLFVCIGGKTQSEQLAEYLDSVQRNDLEGAAHAFSELDKDDDAKEEDELYRHVSRFIFVSSISRLFGVLFWFILLGPAAALCYRLCHWYAEEVENDSIQAGLLRSILHWFDWLPARVSALLFLMTGDFVCGFYRLKDYLYDADADNAALIADTGVAALGLGLKVSDNGAEENRLALSLVDRTLILYIVLAALLTPFGLWP